MQQVTKRFVRYTNEKLSFFLRLCVCVCVSQRIVRENPSEESVKNIPPLNVLFRKRERYVG